jgi:hypothetical protein
MPSPVPWASCEQPGRQPGSQAAWSESPAYKLLQQAKPALSGSGICQPVAGPHACKPAAASAAVAASTARCKQLPGCTPTQSLLPACLSEAASRLPG